jgi:hypothetical protein
MAYLNLPSAYGQSIGIISTNYPQSTVATDLGSLDIRVQLSYSGVKNGYYIIVLLFDTERMMSNIYSSVFDKLVRGTADASPTTCTPPQSVDVLNLAACMLYPSQSSGFENVTFHVSERKSGTWKLSISACMYDNQGNQLSSTCQGPDLSIDVTYIPLWVIALLPILGVFILSVLRRGRRGKSTDDDTVVW